MKDRSNGARSTADLARMVEYMSLSAGIQHILCGTDDGLLFYALLELGGDLPLTPATPNAATFDSLKEQGFDPVRLSVRVTDKYNQARNTIGRALVEGRVEAGDLVLCVVGHALPGEGSDLILVTEVEPSLAAAGLAEMLRLAEGIRPQVLEEVMRIACRIGQVAGRGKRLGALLVVGDSDRVLEGSRQLVPNPFESGVDVERRLTDPAVGDMFVELAKLDGAFVLRGDGLIRAAGSYLTTGPGQVVVPQGLGARHVAAAAITTRTRATAFAVSATDGHVRVFTRGVLTMHLDPMAEVPFGTGETITHGT